MRNFLFSLLASASVMSGSALAGEIFSDEFDTAIDGRWTVLRPAPDNFAVENGQLLLISSKAGSLADNTVENVLIPNIEMPGGDWTMSVKFSGEFQTARENLSFGIMESEITNLTAAVATSGDRYYGWSISAGITHSRDKDAHSFWRRLANMGCNVCGEDRMFPAFAATIPQPIEAKLEKRGHQYIVSARLGAEKTEWTILERITAINAKGKPILYLRQDEQVTGETVVKIDSFRIESNE